MPNRYCSCSLPSSSSWFAFGLLACLFASSAGMGAERVSIPYKVPAKLQDIAVPAPISTVSIEGWIGDRILANATNRLLTVDTRPLLAGFMKKPGSHPWIGEHVGKWMHAATLAWAWSGNAALKQKLDGVVAELIEAQEPDGYLGTYVPEKRFGLYQDADWDVWSHKYNLIGLLTYYEYTGDQKALSACKKIGDLLIATFGPGKKSILSAGTHVGMAATSVLEPMVLLYRHTGDERYLNFCTCIVQSWSEPNGPRIIDSLLTTHQVNKTANAKAYEMLSNLVGLCEMVRVTGDTQLLEAALNAWRDVVNNRLYITGSASQGEHFREDHELPNDTGAHVGETCVTTTWIQFNLQLLRLTGQGQFANELEKTIYNHLAAAQHPRGDDWCYFTALSGRKPYTGEINCCHSSGPRGMALAPFNTFLKSRLGGGETLVVSTFETGAAELELGGSRVRVSQKSSFPEKGRSEIVFEGASGKRFALGVRVPPWAGSPTLRLNGKSVTCNLEQGWLVIPAREWKDQEKLSVEFALHPVVIEGQHGNKGLAALTYGPFVLAYDNSMQSALPGANLVAFASKPDAKFTAGKPLKISASVVSPRFPRSKDAAFVPFADAGSRGGQYKVWLPQPGSPPMGDADSVLTEGEQSASRPGNVDGSIIDGDPGTFIVTFDGRKAAEDWYAVTLEQPQKVGRIVFTSGNIFHDGGWFDASKGKPRVQIKRTASGQWETVGELTAYPATTATDPTSLRDSAKRKFERFLDPPVAVYGVRVIGVPACGDNPNQAFSSCAELQAYSK